METINNCQQELAMLSETAQYGLNYGISGTRTNCRGILSAI